MDTNPDLSNLHLFPQTDAEVLQYSEVLRIEQSRVQAVGADWQICNIPSHLAEMTLSVFEVFAKVKLHKRE